MLQITEFVERLIMAKERKPEEEMAEWGRLWRMCKAQEQSCATHQGTLDGVHVAEGEPKSKRVWQGLLYTGAFFFFKWWDLFVCPRLRLGLLIEGEGGYQP